MPRACSESGMDSYTHRMCQELPYHELISVPPIDWRNVDVIVAGLTQFAFVCTLFHRMASALVSCVGSGSDGYESRSSRPNSILRRKSYVVRLNAHIFSEFILIKPIQQSPQPIQRKGELPVEGNFCKKLVGCFLGVLVSVDNV